MVEDRDLHCLGRLPAPLVTLAPVHVPFSFDPNANRFEQYLVYIGQLARGDLGTSITSTGTTAVRRSTAR